MEERIHGLGGTATIAPLDLTENDSIARLATAIAGRWKALDLLVLNAAMLGTLTPVPAIDPKELAKLLTLNVTAQAALLAAFDPMLRASDDAKVIGLTSSVAQRPRAYWGAYAASKAALETLLLSYGEEMKTISKVRVAIVDPGATATAMRARAYPGEDAATIQQPDDVAAAILRFITEPFATGFRFHVAGSARDQVEAV